MNLEIIETKHGIIGDLVFLFPKEVSNKGQTMMESSNFCRDSIQI